jgi:hypothetical protein
MPAIQTQIKGAALYGAMLLKADHWIPLGAAEALYEVGKIVFKQSQEQVPVKTGELKGTGQLDGPMELGAGKEWAVVITYGSGSTHSYARIQHWRTRLHHRSGGRARFLVRPGNTARRTVGGKVLEKVKERVDSL